MNESGHVPAQTARHATESLTERELEVLELAGKGLSVKGAALELGISPATVRWHLKNAYQKLGVSSREKALRKARDGNLMQSLSVCRICACAMASRTWMPAEAGSSRQ